MGYETRKPRFEARLLAMRAEFPQAADWLNQIPKSKWTQAYDEGKWPLFSPAFSLHFGSRLRHWLSVSVSSAIQNTRSTSCVRQGRGRDISQDVPEADVPRRRRPTASARRQRVTQRVEDVPQLPEDVPHVSNGSPEMTGAADGVETDRVASDGSLGALADDEGFPGGPRDPSVLIEFVDHVAHNIWSGQERPDLKLVSHGRKVDKFGRPDAEIEGVIVATGLDPLIRCSVITIDPGLIFAFVERWHRETSSFHLPVEEVTITLDDVSSLLHILITGALHSFKQLVTSNAVALLTKLLKVTPDEATAETRQAFRDLGQAGAFSWGATALVHLYDQLNEASQAPTRQMVGYISLLQCWNYEHFPSVHRCVVDDGYAEASPRAYRWHTGKA
ncbi:protein MAIN-LIKE 2-like [Glycine max]|uniref:protein MAIN-LIKE 2-like n=1 Tax=Glycine max TaxID=3847 RepID=UPI0003DEA119|nr:protein MAIN-LIKE 2-like [Glycine max]|eukprot:XP_006591665.1 protein MAIN-LIKE 2-like [Glycine max]